jgi:hypothetical protein
VERHLSSNILPCARLVGRGDSDVYASFVDDRGIRHSVDVKAETLFEAAAAGIAIFKQDESGEDVALGTPFDVEVRAPAVRHQLTMMQIRRWCDGVAMSPDEVLKRNRVRALLK